MKAKRGKTILLVEDNGALRDSIGAVLRLRGYNVLSAGDGPEALEISSKLKSGIDLLITDIVLPKMNGVELAEQILQQRPTIKILLMTGYTEQTALQRFGLPEHADFIQKPSSMDELLKKIRALLTESE